MVGRAQFRDSAVGDCEDQNERDDRDADFENTEIDETLAAIAEEGEPNYGEILRITL
ncbi:hypothetical protein ACWD3Z_00375 [Streptomyces sp. NPDC002740]